MPTADELWNLYNSNNSKKSIWTIDSVGQATSCHGRILARLKHPETGANYWMQKYMDNGSVNYAGPVKEDTILRDINMLDSLFKKSILMLQKIIVGATYIGTIITIAGT